MTWPIRISYPTCMEYRSLNSTMFHLSHSLQSHSQSQSQFDLVDNSDWYPCPYTPTFHDNNLANFSEASFNSTTELHDIMHTTPPLSSLNTNLNLNLNLSSSSSCSVGLKKTSLAATAQAHLNQFSGRTTPISIKHESPPPPPPPPGSSSFKPLQTSQSMPHQLTISNFSSLSSSHSSSSNNNLHSALASLHPHPHQHPHHQSTHPSPLSTHLPGPALVFQNSPTSSASPLVNQYKALDLNSPTQPILPPQNTFRHNSDSSFNSTSSETPRRTTSLVFKKKSQGSSHAHTNIIPSTPLDLTPLKTISKKTSLAGLDGTKTKKYTRQRLLPRSKNGCWICRIKHLKCDECKPVCKSCHRFGIECDYSAEKPLYVSDKTLRKEKLASIAQSRKSSSSGGIQKKKSRAQLIS